MENNKKEILLEENKEQDSEDSKKFLQKKRKIAYPQNTLEKRIEISETLTCRFMVNDLGSFIDFRYINSNGEYTKKGLRMRIIDFKKALPEIQEVMDDLKQKRLMTDKTCHKSFCN